MSDDGRLDLDDLGHVIDGARPIDVIGTDDGRPTVGERLKSAGITPWIRRHRVPLAAATVAVVALTGFAWSRRDTRPPDDGQLHVAVVDPLSQNSIGNPGDGVMTAVYTLVPERPGDHAELLGITGPGIGSSSVDAAVVDTQDRGRTSVPVTGTLDCTDRAALTAKQDEYRLTVRRTDTFGRTATGQVPLPLGSNASWSTAVATTCLQKLASTDLAVESVRATAEPLASRVGLELILRSSAEVELELGIASYAGTAVRPDTAGFRVPARGAATLRIVENVTNCDSPHLEGVIMAPDGQSGMEVSDRTLDVYASVADQALDVQATGVTLSWSEAQANALTRAFAAVCAGMPAYQVRVVSSGPAPGSVREAASVRANDPSTTVVRTVLAIRTTADRMTLADMAAPQDILNGAVPTVTIIDATTGRALSTIDAARPVRPVDGVARVAVDWTFSCAGGYYPTTARLLLSSGSRTWPVWLPLDQRAVANGVIRACPGTTLPTLADSGWLVLQQPSSG